MKPARRLERPSVGETVHVDVTRSQLRRLARQGVHLTPSTPAPAADPEAAEAVERANALRRDLAARTAERDSLAARLEVLQEERGVEASRLRELERELLERERRIASLHAQLVHWQHQARRAQRAARHAPAPAPDPAAPDPAAATSLLDPLPRRVIAEIRESLERTADDPRPWLSPARLSTTTRQRWIAALAVLAIVAPVAAVSRRLSGPEEAADQAAAQAARTGAERTREAARAALASGPPLPQELLVHVPRHVAGLGGTRPPWLPALRPAPEETPPAPRASGAPVAGPPLPPRSFGPPRFAASFASALAAHAALRAPWETPRAEPEGMSLLARAYPHASPTQRRRIAQEMRPDLGAGLGLVGWRSALAPDPDGVPRELVAFPIVGADLAIGPIGLWLWVGERHDPDARVEALGPAARTWSAHAPADVPEAVPPAELLRAYAGIALRLGTSSEPTPRRRLRRVPLHRPADADDADGADLVVLLRRHSTDPARLAAAARATLEAHGREAGRVAFHELVPLPDARGWEERRTRTLDLPIRDSVVGPPGASPR